MNFELNERQKMIQEMVREVAQKEIRPVIREWDEREEFPKPIVDKLAELGLFGIIFPEEYGGVGMGYMEYVIVLDELAREDPGTSLTVAANTSLCTNHLYSFASEEIKREFIPKLAKGEIFGAWGLTEPGTGSDAKSITTFARKDGSDWILNGTKTFITNASIAGVAVVMALTNRDEKRISSFVIPKGTKGFRPGKKEKKLGCNTSDTAELILEDCRIPGEWLLGKEGDGFKQAMQVLDGGRISIAAMALGTAEGALRTAVSYAKTRHAFGQPIAEFQGMQFKLATMHTQIEAARLLTLQSAYLKDKGLPVTKESAMAKFYASEIAVRASEEAVQTLGGYGYTRDYMAEKFYRDAKLTTIGEGTSEIQRLVIAREILRK